MSSVDQRDSDVSLRLQQWACEIGRNVFSPAKFPLQGLAPDATNEALESLSGDQTFAVRIVSDLFPQGCPSDLSVVYRRIAMWDSGLPTIAAADRLLAAVFTRAYRSWPAEQNRLLEALNAPDHDGFVCLLDALATFLGENELPALFAAGWFVAVAERHAREGGGAGFELGLRAYAVHFPEYALKVVELLLSDEANDQALVVAAGLLGICRGIDLPKAAKTQLGAVELKWLSNRRPDARFYLHRSWIPTARERALTPVEFDALLERLGQGSAREFTDGFNVVMLCLASTKTRAEVCAQGLAWLRRHASSSLEPEAKYYVAVFVHNAPESPGDLDDLLGAIQPVAPELQVIWQVLETVLVKRLKERPIAEFVELFLKLADQSNGAFGALLKVHRTMERLSVGLSHRTGAADALMANLLFSHDRHRRRLGRRLFERLATGTLSSAVYAGKNDGEVMLGLLEFRRALAPRASAVADFLLLIAPFADAAGAGFKEEYADEVLVQAKNFPGACLRRFKAAAGKSAIIAEVVPQVEAYAAALRAAGNSPLGATAVPGFDRAWHEQQRRFSNQVQEGAREQLPLMQIFPEVHMLFGDSFAVDNGGELNPTAFKNTEVGTEFPGLDFIDPEGMILRRINAVGAIEYLEKHLGATPPPPNGSTR